MRDAAAAPAGNFIPNAKIISQLRQGVVYLTITPLYTSEVVFYECVTQPTLEEFMSILRKASVSGFVTNVASCEYIDEDVVVLKNVFMEGKESYLRWVNCKNGCWELSYNNA